MTEQVFKITGMDCMDCAKGLQASVAALAKVKEADVRFFDSTLIVKGDVDVGELRDTITKLGYGIDEGNFEGLAPAAEPNALVGFWRYLGEQLETRLALIGGLMVLLSFVLGWLNLPNYAIVGLQVAALALAGWPIARSGVMNLWVNHTFNINFLMTIAGIGALVIGEFAEAAAMIILFDLAEALEGFTNERARNAIAQLNELSPTHAIKIDDDTEQIVPVESLEVGDIMMISPGERIPLDGTIREGQSDINQASITGESIPVWKQVGDEVFSGTVNGSGRLLVTVTHLVGDSTLHRIITMVTEAQSRQSRSQKFIDRFAQYYTPAMVFLAILMAVLPPLLFGAPFTNLADGTRGWLYRSLSLLVIGCPCALVISTPVTMVAGLTKAAKEGILFKGGVFLEGLSRVNVVAFDKTGTLTKGEPQVVDLKDLDCQGTENCEPCNDLLSLAVALEKHSTHPLAQAIVNAADSHGVLDSYPPATNLVTRLGRGIEGVVNGNLMTVGSRRLFEEEHKTPDIIWSWVDQAEADGKTAMLLCDGDRVRGFIAVADTLREETPGVISELKDMNITPIMLTGDNATVAHAVGEKIGLDEIRSGLLPEDKQAEIIELSQAYGKLAMVGDGINDAPALAEADIGIAMGGSGSAQAMETADVVLMAGDIHKLPFAIKLSAFANRLVRQNISFSLGSKLLVAVIALFGYAPLWLAVLADMGVSLLVTMNGLRAMRFKG